MSRYFNWPVSLKRFLRFDTARAEDVNRALDELTTGLGVLDTDVNRALKLPAGTTDQTLALTAGQRANLTLGFDAAGNVLAFPTGRFRGDWSTGQLYFRNEVLRDSITKDIYAVLVQHTSGVLASDIAAARLQLMVNVAEVEAARLNAQQSAQTATTQAGNATTQAGISTTQAGISTTQAGNAAGSASTASSQAASVLTMDKRYLGSKANAPTLDNQGAALATGAVYYDTVLASVRTWNGSAWVAGISAVAGVASVNSATGAVNVQPTLVSGANLRTINGASLLAAGNLELGSSLVRSARTLNTALAAADNSRLIDLTSGTFTQTFSAAATLGNGWFCYIRNSGTGDITLDPNASELIDGLTSYVMYPGEVRLVQCDGVELRSVVLSTFAKTFITSGTFIKPPGYSYFGALIWSAGASGAKNLSTTNSGSGFYAGGGGGCWMFNLPAAFVGATELVTVGAGGVRVITDSTAGNVGGSTSFGSLAEVSGQPTALGTGGQGGSLLKNQVSPTADFIRGGSPAGNPSVTPYIWGGASGSVLGASPSASSVYGGGGGGTHNGTTIRDAGFSTFGGNGGAASVIGDASDGNAPGGGGGMSRNGIGNSGAGGRGELRMWGTV